MIKQVQIRKNKLDSTLWLIIFILVASGIVGNYYFVQSILLRVILLLTISSLAIGIASKTIIGTKLWKYWQEVLLELRKVVWPTRQETMRSTLAVLAMVFIMGLLLWGIDAMLIKIIAKLISRSGV